MLAHPHIQMCTLALTVGEASSPSVFQVIFLYPGNFASGNGAGRGIESALMALPPAPPCATVYGQLVAREVVLPTKSCTTMVMTEPQAPDRAKSGLFILPLKEGAPECILGKEALEGPRAGAPAAGTCAGWH